MRTLKDKLKEICHECKDCSNQMIDSFDLDEFYGKYSTAEVNEFLKEDKVLIRDSSHDYNVCDICYIFNKLKGF